MEDIPVIAADDKELTIGAEDYLPIKTDCQHRFYWMLKKQISKDEERGETTRDIFNKYKAFLAGEEVNGWGKLEGKALVLVDLALLIGGLNSEEEDELDDWIKEGQKCLGNPEEGLREYENQQEVGVYLIGKVLSNPHWSGVVVVASNQVPGGLLSDVSALEAAFDNQRVSLIENGDGAVSTNTYANPIDNGIEEFERRFCPHPDPCIAEAMNFWAMPWTEEWDCAWWDHDKLQKDSHHRRSVENWLGREVNDKEAKGLFLWPAEREWEAKNQTCQRLRENWHGDAEYRSGRPIRGGVLRRVFDRLCIPTGTELPDEEEYVLPFEPAFPFLVSLRNLYYVMKNEGAPPKKITLQKRGGDPTFYMLRLELSPYYETDEGDRVYFDRWGLAKQYYQFDRMAWWEGKGVPGGKRTTTRALKALTYARTSNFRDSYLDDYAFMPLFKRGAERPVVSVSFGPQHVHLLWTSE